MTSAPQSAPLFSRPITPWYVTTALLLVGFVFIKTTEAMIGMTPPPEGIIIDKLHLWTAPINRFFHQHSIAKNTILTITTLWIDASILFLCLRSLFGPTIRPYLELLLFALCRQGLQFLVSLPIPQGIIWSDPGFPSLMINYSLQHDLFFSAHTGIAFLATIELLRTGKKWLGLIGFCFFVLTVMTIIFLRFHYTMDIFTGFLVAALIVLISKPLSQSIDQMLQRFTLKT